MNTENPQHNDDERKTEHLAAAPATSEPGAAESATAGSATINPDTAAADTANPEARATPTAEPAATAPASADFEAAGTEAAPPVSPAATDRRRPRTGPIVWGALILVFCAYITQRKIAPDYLDTTVWVIASVIGLGALLLIVAIAAIVRSRADQRR